jgi:hypothetical protein
MIPAVTPLDARLADVLAATPPRIPVVPGWCGSGRTDALLRLQSRLGANRCQYVDVERVATTPERFFEALVAPTPFRMPGHSELGAKVTSPRAGFDAVLVFLAGAQTADGLPATFLLDEALELRTFENFPGLRDTIPELLAAVADSPNRFVLTTRFATRARRLVRSAPGRLVIVEGLGVSPAVITGLLASEGLVEHETDGLSTTAVVHALTQGHAGYVREMLTALSQMARDGIVDPVGAFASLLSRRGRLSASCRFCYELRLHRARGYGALKAILDVLAQEQPLTLTAIAKRLGRTPGSTKDYLSWLEDVDLVQVHNKRYSFGDPVLRLWVKLNGRSTVPTEDEIAREVQRYAAEMLTSATPTVAAAEDETAAVVGEPRRSWGIIEID